MAPQSWKKKAYFFGMIGCIQFIIISVIAMFFYAGGHENNPSAPGYTFWSNFLSDLARTVAWSGKSNLISYIIYSATSAIWCITAIPLFLALPSDLAKSREGKRYCNFGSFFAITCAIVSIGVLLAPADLYWLEHVVLSVIFYISLLLVCTSYFIFVFNNTGFPKRYTGGFLISIIFMLAFFISLLIGGGRAEWLSVQVTLQKLIHYTIAVVVFLVSYDAWKLANQKSG